MGRGRVTGIIHPQPSADCCTQCEYLSASSHEQIPSKSSGDGEVLMRGRQAFPGSVILPPIGRYKNSAKAKHRSSARRHTYLYAKGCKNNERFYCHAVLNFIINTVNTVFLSERVFLQLLAAKMEQELQKVHLICCCCCCSALSAQILRWGRNSWPGRVQGEDQPICTDQKKPKPCSICFIFIFIWTDFCWCKRLICPGVNPCQTCLFPSLSFSVKWQWLGWKLSLQWWDYLKARMSLGK